jgi:hypothetical protein
MLNGANTGRIPIRRDDSEGGGENRPRRTDERQSSELIAPRREQTDEKSTFQTRTKEGQAGDAGLANFDDSVLRPEPEPGDKGRGFSDKN